MVDISRRLACDALPHASATLGFRFADGWGPPNWWLVVKNGRVDICDMDPGYEPDLGLGAPLRPFTDAHVPRPKAAAT